jgi:hypothetical protein
MTDERWIDAVRNAAQSAMLINHGAPLDGPMALLILENMGKHITDLRNELVDLRREYGKLARGEVFVHL